MPYSTNNKMGPAMKALKVFVAMVLVWSLDVSAFQSAFASEGSDTSQYVQTDGNTEGGSGDGQVPTPDQGSEVPESKVPESEVPDADEPTEALPPEEGVPNETDDTEKGTGAEPGITPLESDVEESAAPLAVSIGDCFLDENDEGVAVVYRVTGPDTVQIGSGMAGATSVINPPGSTNRQFTTITTSNNGSVTIPSTVYYDSRPYRVTKVGDDAFGYYYSNSSIITFAVNQIILPPSITSIGASAFAGASLSRGITYSGDCNVTEIGDYAFSGCGMTSFTMPSSVTTIGRGIFAGYALPSSGGTRYTQITSITFPDDCKIAEIPASAFSYSNLADIRIPSSVTSIGNNAFQRSYLGSITIPNTVSNLGTGVFTGCTKLVAVTIEDGSPLTEIPSSTFYGCPSLRSFTIPSFISSIENSAFQTSGLTSITIPKTVTYLGSSVFEECTELASVTFGQGNQILHVSSRLFAGCRMITSIDLPDNIRSIGDSAFTGCTDLRYIDIPPLCTTLGSFTFQDCTALKTVTFEGNAKGLSSSTSTFHSANGITSIVFLGKKSKNLAALASMATTYYTISYYNSKSDMQSGIVSKRFSIAANSIPTEASGNQIFSGTLQDPPENMRWVVEDGFSFTGEITDSFAVYAEPAVAELKLGDTFTAKTVEGVDITYTVTSMNEDDRVGEVMVGTFDFDKTATAVGSDTSGSITVPTQVVAPDANTYTVTGIGAYAFYNCGRFIEITIPETITTIGEYAFYRCSTLRNIVFNGNAASIVDKGIFTSCSNIKQVVFGGKKANVAFGSSAPAVYYTVRYYDSKHDLSIGNVEARVLVRERALLGRLGDSDVLAGSVPSLSLGYQWAYEAGFSATAPLTDSCYVYADGIGFQFTVDVMDGNVSRTPCWFKILSFDPDTKEGTVTVGLGEDGITAIYQAVSGVPVIPSTVTDAAGNTYTVVGVSDYAFGSETYWTSCQYLVSVSLPPTVIEIGKAAFKNCTSLSWFTLPGQLTTMGQEAFRKCTSLSDISLEDAPLLTAIPPYAFEGDYHISEVSIQSNVKSIGAYAFSNCYGYSPVTLSYTGIRSLDVSKAHSLQIIDNAAFSGDILLSGVLTFPENLTTIAGRAFSGCSRITELIFPPSVSYIGSSAFQQGTSIRKMTFTGDANSVVFGAGAFSISDNGGNLQSVVFKGKKSSTITDYISVGTVLSRDNDYGRSYRLYYTVKFYRNKSSFQAGQILRESLVLENDRARSYGPDLASSHSWLCEAGFSVDQRTTDSYWAYAGYDIKYATWSGIGNIYYYTGGYIKPVPTVMLGGKVLIPGVDYTYNTAMGYLKDGYTNNRRMGIAGIHLLGIGDYAGSLEIPFEIAMEYGGNTAFNVSAITQSFTYDGTAHEPAPNITASVKGRPYEVREGTDYTRSYRNNVNAGTAQMFVAGMGIFADVKSVDFTIKRRDISTCNVDIGILTYDESGKLDIDTEATYTNREGTTLHLVEGEDYKVIRIPSSLTSVTVFIQGIGNYGGVFSEQHSLPKKTERPPGDPYGSGEGDGSGGGSGSGRGSGPGNALGTGSGTGGNYGTGVTVGGVSGNPGSAGGSPYSIYGLSGTGAPLEDGHVYYPVEKVLFLVVPIVALGIIYGYRRWWYQYRWLRGDSELKYYEPPQPPPASGV